MRYSIAPLALAALAYANPMPQGVTSAISPSSTDPAGCSSSYSGKFEIQVVNVTGSAKREVQKRQDTALVISLANGVLTDAKGRTGYIAANNQFQFDGPPQTGAIYTSGWSVCSNGSLALGASSIFYQCLSGTFYNLYDESTGAQCSPVYIDVIGTGSTSAAASQTSDGQITASAVASQETDGQITASAVSSAVCEYTDGQPQVTGCVTQISDGQIQATSAAAPVSQISDGQIQATSAAAPVSQISDGQIQATTSAAAVSQISDGQIQATTSAAAVSQISDGQIQATSAAAPVTQISDGQIQATVGANSTVASPTASSVAIYTGAAMPTAIGGQLFGLAAGVLAVAML
ncbi:hypothetical protein LTR85_007690 [Meristemomyces frigidus]|nr:hypothetical protein LTR85_007690 [Meristemomyces frigidus]